MCQKQCYENITKVNMINVLREISFVVGKLYIECIIFEENNKVSLKLSAPLRLFVHIHQSFTVNLEIDTTYIITNELCLFHKFIRLKRNPNPNPQQYTYNWSLLYCERIYNIRHEFSINNYVKDFASNLYRIYCMKQFL